MTSESGVPGDTATTLAALYRASRSLSPAFSDKFPRTTLLELQATGRLALIRSPDVRAAVLDYYTEIDGTGPLLDLLPREYRDFIRRVLPADLQATVRAECSVFETANDGALECEAPLDGFDARSIFLEVAGNTDLARDLTFSRQQLAIGLAQLRALLDRTDSLLTMLEAAVE